ncbi:MAG: FimB/Mfa2 family fimbrial subunit [Bacteroidales bacterium]|nr:FimB/Mfa2 family fimbrial subunit [Bacteroidales bacterium]
MKVALHDTDHPGGGKIVSLNADRTDVGTGTDVPADYNVKIGDYTTTLSEMTGAVDLLPPGTYHVNMWNTAEHITVDGTTATADYSDGLIGWFFTGVADQTVEADRDYTIDVPMRQQVRELTLALEPTGDAKDLIADVAASLSGVAGAIDIETGNPVGAAVSVNPAFEKGSDGKYYATIRLLGVTGTEQKLSLTLRYAGGNPSAQTVVCDLSSQLAAFNADKKTPLTLNAIVVVTPTANGFSATIEEWEENGKTIIAK